MKITKLIQRENEEIVAYKCDACDKEIEILQIECQEMLHIDYVCGYASIFGDGSRVTGDFCQECVKEYFNGFLTVWPSYYWDENEESIK